MFWVRQRGKAGDTLSSRAARRRRTVQYEMAWNQCHKPPRHAYDLSPDYATFAPRLWPHVRLRIRIITPSRLTLFLQHLPHIPVPRRESAIFPGMSPPEPHVPLALMEHALFVDMRVDVLDLHRATNAPHAIDFALALIPHELEPGPDALGHWVGIGLIKTHGLAVRILPPVMEESLSVGCFVVTERGAGAANAKLYAVYSRCHGCCIELHRGRLHTGSPRRRRTIAARQRLVPPQDARIEDARIEYVRDVAFVGATFRGLA